MTSKSTIWTGLYHVIALPRHKRIFFADFGIFVSFWIEKSIIDVSDDVFDGRAEMRASFAEFPTKIG